VRVHALTLHPDGSALVRLRPGFLTVTLPHGEIINWDAGKSPMQHFQMPQGETSLPCLGTFCATPRLLEKGVAGGFRKDRPNDYRNITFEFWIPTWVGPSKWQRHDRVAAFDVVGGALVSDVLLQPGDSFCAPDKPNARLVIPISDLDLKCGAGIRVRNSPGELAWIAGDQRAARTNAGRDLARFITVEFRPRDYSVAPPAR